MSFDFSSLRRVIILADESAHWKIAGLRQLDRISLALNKAMAEAEPAEQLEVLVFWRSTVSPKDRLLPDRGRLPYLRVTPYATEEISEAGKTLVLTTRLFVTPGALSYLCEIAPGGLPEVPAGRSLDYSWLNSFRLAEQSFRSYSKAQREREGWRYLTQSRDISHCESFLLRYNGKSQDGLVSRFVNRPLTRPLTRLLLRLPVAPNVWTLLTASLPIVGALFLLRGDYTGFLFGMLCYQLFSMLDGCDGEIARAKYLESFAGKRLDTLCDTLGNLLLLVCLGFGLSKENGASPFWRQFYLGEGIVAACLTALNEILLWFSSRATERSDVNGALYARHIHLVENSGILLLGGTVTGWLVQLTKRDVAIMGFLLLSVIGAAQWILHLSLAFAIVSLVLASKAIARRPSEPDL